MCLNLGPRFCSPEINKIVKGRVYTAIESVTEFGVRLGFLSCTSGVEIEANRPPITYNGWKFYKWADFLLPTMNSAQDIGFRLKALPIKYSIACSGPFHFEKCSEDMDEFTTVHGMRLMPTCLKTGWYIWNVLEFTYKYGCQYTSFSEGRLITLIMGTDVAFFLIHKVNRRRNRKKTKNERKKGQGEKMVLQIPKFEVFRINAAMVHALFESVEDRRSCTVMNLEEFTSLCTVVENQN